MSEFKVGDYVKIVAPNLGSGLQGATGVITGESADYWKVSLDDKKLQSQYGGYALALSDELQLLEEPVAEEAKIRALEVHLADCQRELKHLTKANAEQVALIEKYKQEKQDIHKKLNTFAKEVEGNYEGFRNQISRLNSDLSDAIFRRDKAEAALEKITNLLEPASRYLFKSKWFDQGYDYARESAEDEEEIEW